MYPRVSGVAELPAAVTLPLVTAVHDQGSLGSCVGQAYARALEIEVGSGIELSALGIYYGARVASGFPAGEDTGAYLEPAVRALAAHGAGSEALWPYLPQRFAVRPPTDYAAQAMDHRVGNWYRARSVAQAKAALASHHPCVTAFDVPPDFGEVGRTGVWLDRGGKAVGAHAVLLWGYDDARGAFRVMNSWGADWGNDGWFWLPYEAYAKDPDGDGRWWDSIVVTTFDKEVD